MKVLWHVLHDGRFTTFETRDEARAHADRVASALSRERPGSSVFVAVAPTDSVVVGHTALAATTTRWEGEESMEGDRG